MNTATWNRLLLLSALWGASFPFMRVAVPELGAPLLVFCRVGLAALLLLTVALHLKQTPTFSGTGSIS